MAPLPVRPAEMRRCFSVQARTHRCRWAAVVAAAVPYPCCPHLIANVSVNVTHPYA